MRKKAVEISQGFPYLMQLVGHYITVYANDCGKISQSSFESALKAANDDFENGLCKTTLNALSEKDVAFLSALAEMPDDSVKISALREKMKIRPDYAQQYKKRLLDAGVIEQPRRGEVSFTMPLLKEYLQKKPL
jgi:DNA-binding IscR family transcriptional regulator